MKVQELFEESGLQHAIRAIEFDADKFKKLGLGPLPKLVDRVIMALPKGAIIRIDSGGESMSFFYSDNEGRWFDNGGRRVKRIQAIVDELKSYAPKDATGKNEFHVWAMVPKA